VDRCCDEQQKRIDDAAPASGAASGARHNSVLAEQPFWWLSRHRAAKPGRAAGTVAFLALFLPLLDVGEPTDTARRATFLGRSEEEISA